MPDQSLRRHVFATRLAIIAVAFVASANLLRPSCDRTVAEQAIDADEVHQLFVRAHPVPAPRWAELAVPRIPVRVLRHPAAPELQLRIAQRIVTVAN